MSVTDDQGQHWLRLSEAAALLGRTDRTLRRWVHDGKLESEMRDGRLWVEVSEYVPRDTTIDDLRSEVDRLRSEVDKLSFQVEQVTGERDRLWTQVQFQNSQIATLMRLTEREVIEPPKTRRWRWPWQGDDN